MPFKPGKPKTGGRLPGVTNKRRSIDDLCNTMGFDPFARLIEIARDPENKDSIIALKELCQYVSPKLKALEHSGSVDRPLRELPNEELLKLLPDAVKVLKTGE